MTLSPYRVLDFTDERGALCGQILGDLGADVIKIEPPGGSPERRLGPFLHDQPHPDRSLSFWAYNRNKRSLTLNLNVAAGREIFERLLDRADFLIESCRPGVMRVMGLSYHDLESRHPGLIHVSITPFGQDGPKADYAATDITIMAAGGPLMLYGDDDRAPTRLSLPQAWLHASADGAVGAMIALHERALSGRGQHVDVSAQQSVALATQFGILATAIEATPFARIAGGIKYGPLRVPLVWRVKDGFVTMAVLFGQGLGPFTAKLMRYVYDEGGCDAALRDEDWIGFGDKVMSGAEPVAKFDHLNSVIREFIASRTKAELFADAVKHGLLLAPVTTIDEVVVSPQFAAREYWRMVEHPELGASFRYPGPFARFGTTPIQYRRRPPTVGEHNHEILAGELHIGEGEVSSLKRRGVI
ncbi:MAG: CaiB/BaiF CoA transferase family protein [Candidatus Binataceae bacterium]